MIKNKKKKKKPNNVTTSADVIPTVPPAPRPVRKAHSHAPERDAGSETLYSVVAAHDAGAAKHKLQDTLDTDLQRGLRVANMEQKSTRN